MRLTPRIVIIIRSAELKRMWPKLCGITGKAIFNNRIWRLEDFSNCGYIFSFIQIGFINKMNIAIVENAEAIIQLKYPI